MNKAEYFERQRFTQWWVWVIFMSINIPFLYGCYAQLVEGTPWGNHPMSDTGLIIVTLLVILFTVSFFLFRLETHINSQGIYVRFYPFQPKHVIFHWEDISDAYIRQYSPLKEYGGWGYRKSFGNNTAYTIKGKIGLQLLLKNNKKVLIGTQQPQKLQQVLNELWKR